MSRASLRLVGGELGGRRLEVAPGVRPTGARVREALFSIWGERVAGCRFLDLFAGSGAVGLEALSRGARHATFVDGSPRSLAALERNLERLGIERERFSVLRLRLPARRDLGPSFDLAYVDPPYAFDAHAALLASIRVWLAPGAELAIEHPARRDPGPLPAAWELVDRRVYGDSAMTFLRVGEEVE